jgi:hypothetical protein
VSNEQECKELRRRCGEWRGSGTHYSLRIVAVAPQRTVLLRIRQFVNIMPVFPVSVSSYLTIQQCFLCWGIVYTCNAGHGCVSNPRACQTDPPFSYSPTSTRHVSAQTRPNELKRRQSIASNISFPIRPMCKCQCSRKALRCGSKNPLPKNQRRHFKRRLYTNQQETQ